MTETLDCHYWRDRARVVLPGATPRQIVRAARILKLQYDAPTVVFDAVGSTLPTWQYAPGVPKPSQEGEDLRDIKPTTVAAPYLTVLADARMFDGVKGGGVPNLVGAPDAWSAIQSTLGTVNGVNKVIRRGHARVQGGTCGTSPDTPSGFSGGLLSQILEDLPANSVGKEGWRVSIVTDLFYGADDQLPGQGGHDTLQSGEHVPRDVDLSMVRGVVRGDSDGNDSRMSWPVRTRLPRVVLRKSEQVWPRVVATRGTFNYATDRLTTRAVYDANGLVRLPMPEGDANGLVPVTVRSLPAPAADASRLFIGHRGHARGKLARATRGGKREARTVTIGTAIALTSPAALAELCQGINRGERVQVRFNGLPITLTRGKGAAGTFTVSTPRGKASGLRTPANVGKRAWELVA